MPGSLIAAGSAQAGKSFFIKQLIEQRDKAFSKPINSVHYFYAEWQPLFDELERQNIIFEQGAPSAEALDKVPPSSLVIIDDLFMTLCDSKFLVRLFTVTVHHRPLFVIFTSHSFFWDSREMRCVSKNATYIAIFKSARQAATVENIGRQLYPHRHGYLLDAYLKATCEPYTYLLLDLHPQTPENMRVLTKILPSDQYPHVFV